MAKAPEKNNLQQLRALIRGIIAENTHLNEDPDLQPPLAGPAGEPKPTPKPNKKTGVRTVKNPGETVAVGRLKLKLKDYIPDANHGKVFRQWMHDNKGRWVSTAKDNMGDTLDKNSKNITSKVFVNAWRLYGEEWVCATSQDKEGSKCQQGDPGFKAAAVREQPWGGLGTYETGGKKVSHVKKKGRHIHTHESAELNKISQNWDQKQAAAQLGIDTTKSGWMLFPTAITKISLSYPDEGAAGITPRSIDKVELRITDSSGSVFGDHKTKSKFATASTKDTNKVGTFLVRNWLKTLDQEKLNMYFNIPPRKE
jgi:hypothetical protein